MSKLCYPTVDLFIYDLKSPLNFQAIEIDRNRQLFQSRIRDKLGGRTGFIPAEQENSDLGYQALLQPDFLELKNNNLEGYFYPVLLNDTYALLVNCSLDETINPPPLDLSLKRIEEELSQYTDYHKNSTIGKTKIISGWLHQEEKNVELIAEECYKNQKILVNKDWKWQRDLYGRGKFLNGHIFEIWNPLSNYLDEHFLIIIFPDQETFEKAVNSEDGYFQDWIRLFCYRHKIMWTYSQSRTIKNVLKNYYKEVDAITKKLEIITKKFSNLKQLQAHFQEIQSILDKFTRKILELNFLKETIEINLDGYVKLIQILKKKSGEESDLSFLEQFSHVTETKYLKQIDKDEANMKLGLQLLESNINALRSQIELEKAERDRNFQNLVAMIGGGTAIISVFDFSGEKCKKITSSRLFHQDAQEYNTPFSCDEFFIGGVLVPVLLLLSAGVFAFILKWIIIFISNKNDTLK
ncbi:MAG: hypothetical protein AB4063_18540 [Crocosphaera sp.]